MKKSEVSFLDSLKEELKRAIANNDWTKAKAVSGILDNFQEEAKKNAEKSKEELEAERIKERFEKMKALLLLPCNKETSERITACKKACDVKKLNPVLVPFGRGNGYKIVVTLGEFDFSYSFPLLDGTEADKSKDDKRKAGARQKRVKKAISK